MNVVLIKWGIAFFNDKLKVLRLKRTSIIYTNIRTVSVKHFLSFRNHTQGNGRTSYILLQVMN